MNLMKLRTPLIFGWLLIALAGCSLPLPSVLTPNATSVRIFNPTPTPRTVIDPSVTPTPTATVTPSATPTPSPTVPVLEPTPTLAPLAQHEREQIFEKVWSTVHEEYLYPDFHGVDWNAVRKEFAPKVAEAQSPEVFYDLMRALIDRLADDHSRFESPQEVVEEDARFEGRLVYGGIGAIVRMIDEGGLIITLAPNGAAQHAGIQPRDLITAINGVPITTTGAFGPEGPISAIRGVPGTRLELLVRSPGERPRPITLMRQVIPRDAFPDVEASRIKGTNVGLVRIDTFYIEDIDTLVRDRIETLLAEGSLDGLIIDVRNNSGGRVDLMLNTLGLFINGGSIGTTGGRTASDEQEIPSDQTIAALNGVPIVVLTSNETVSAAEMFAAGMQVLGRATLVGTATAGNTENLLAHYFSDGSRLWLAQLAYRLPNGTLIEGRGVIPDHEVTSDWWRYTVEEDPQIVAAISELRAQNMSAERRT